MTIARRFDKYGSTHPRTTLLTGFMSGVLVVAAIAVAGTSTLGQSLLNSSDQTNRASAVASTAGSVSDPAPPGATLDTSAPSATPPRAANERHRDRLFEQAFNRPVRVGFAASAEQIAFAATQETLFAEALTNEEAAAWTTERQRLTARSRQRPVSFGTAEPPDPGVAAFIAAEEHLLGWLTLPPPLLTLNEG